MRKGKVRPKPVKKHTKKERAHLRSVQRRTGGSATRRRELRHKVLRELECGCKETRVKMITCPQHTPAQP